MLNSRQINWCKRINNKWLKWSYKKTASSPIYSIELTYFNYYSIEFLIDSVHIYSLILVGENKVIRKISSME
jgi:hypothetical protein